MQFRSQTTRLGTTCGDAAPPDISILGPDPGKKTLKSGPGPFSEVWSLGVPRVLRGLAGALRGLAGVLRGLARVLRGLAWVLRDSPGRLCVKIKTKKTSESFGWGSQSFGGGSQRFGWGSWKFSQGSQRFARAALC